MQHDCGLQSGCSWNCGTPQGSVVEMTDADWAGVKDRRSYSGIAVWVKGSVENTWYPVYASSKRQNMACLSSGESELMALVGGACEGIATRDQWSKMCNCSPGTIAVHGQFSSSGIRETQKVRVDAHSPRGHEGLLYAGLGDGTWTTNLEGAWRQSASRWLPHEDHDTTSGSSQSPGTLTDAAILSNIDEVVRKIAAHQITASDLFTITLPDNMRMKFVMTTT